MELHGLGAKVSYQRNWVIQKTDDVVGFVFPDLGLKFQNLQRKPKQITCFFCAMFPDFRFVLGILTTYVTTKCNKCIFLMENHID